MNKKFIIVAVLAIAVVASAFAAPKGAVGLQIGYPGIAVVYEEPLNGSMDVYGSVGYNWAKEFALLAGVEQDVYSVDVKDTTFNIECGVQSGLVYRSGKGLAMPLLATASTTYDVKIKDVSLTTFARVGVGMYVNFSTKPNPAGQASIGALYKF